MAGQEYKVGLDSSAALATLKPARIPPFLYHYTTRGGLLGIVGEGTIHASDIFFLNDSREFLYAEDLAKEVIARAMGVGGNEKLLYEQIAKLLDRIELLRYRQGVCVFSMSEVGDQLSQWRAYSHPGDGYSIGFRVEELLIVLGEDVRLVQCTYDEAKHEQLIGSLLAEAETDVRRNRTSGLDEGALAIGGGTYFLLGLLRLAPSLKHPAFNEEKEWRLILTPKGRGTVKYRTGRSFLVPHLSIPIVTEHGFLPIVDIITAPGPHPQLDSISLRSLLDARNCSECSVNPSEIPYRSW